MIDTELKQREYFKGRFEQHFGHLDQSEQMKALDLVRRTVISGKTIDDIGNALSQAGLVVPRDSENEMLTGIHHEQVEAIAGYYHHDRVFLNEKLDNMG